MAKLIIKTEDVEKHEEKQLTVRQFCYNKKYFVENTIISLERTYGQQTKTFEQWEAVANKKKINFL